MNKKKTLILTRREIEELIDMKKAISVSEMAFSFYGRGKSQMPAKIYLHLDKYNGDFRAMPAFLEGPNACAVKWVNVHPDNKLKKLPTVMAAIILSDPKTGFPLSVMDGTFITNVRTGAAGGLAAKYLARKDSRTVGLIGCGEQAKTQLQALITLFKIKEVNVWGHQKSYVARFIKQVKDDAYRLVASSSVRECVDGCDIIVTTTPSRKPLVKAQWLKEGVHINAIGADAHGKQELDQAVLKRAKVVIDDWPQASHSGEINLAVSKGLLRRADIHAELAEIILGKKRGRADQKEITVFDSTGLAIQDAALAQAVYHTALKRRAGRLVNLIGI